MATGVIRWFSELRGYGFIDSLDDDRLPPLYVHHTAIQGRGFRSLETGQAVRYEVQGAGEGRRAVAVEAL
ncbi:cold-shock protein [bacterium]|nr:MAG: cold-shock protein [bacterium]RKZ17883.1 MAG: cold-shock protein [bacterium]